MLDEIPQVLRVMRPFPYTVDVTDTLAHARGLMAEHEIGHLPVKRGNDLVGLLTANDVSVFERTPRESLEEHTVEEVANTTDLFVVPTTTRLDEVVSEMGRRGADAALIVTDGRLAGILTASDVCHILGQLLSTGQIPPHDELWREPAPPEDIA